MEKQTMNKPIKLAIIGGGGVRTPLLVRGILKRQDIVSLKSVYFMDIDERRLQCMRKVVDTMLDVGNTKFKVFWTTDPREAIKDADFVMTTFRVGMDKSRAIDERIPLNYDVLGQETTGPGGFAMAMRSIPVLLEYAKIIKEISNDAWLINFANPSGILAEAVLKYSNLEKVVGICDNPTAMVRIMANTFKVSTDDLTLEYFGLNHLGWIKKVCLNGKDVLPQAIKKIVESGIEHVNFDPLLIKTLGVIPNEYLVLYYDTQKAIKGIKESNVCRGEEIVKLNEELFAELDKVSDETGKIQKIYLNYLRKRGETYMTREAGEVHPEEDFEHSLDYSTAKHEGYEGTALGLIESLIGLKKQVLILNVFNKGSIIGMEDDDVVEVPCYVYKDIIRPLSIGSVPDEFLGLMKQVKAYERLTIDAAVNLSYQSALKALTIHPLVPTVSVAKKVLDDYIEAFGDLFPKLMQAMNSQHFTDQFAIISHRGATEFAPENTLAAFSKALKLGFDIEFDIQRSKDGHLVVIHDTSVDRTTNGHGLVKDLTFRELRDLDAGSWFSPNFKREKIPTFEEVLNLVQGKALLAINFQVVGTEEAIVRSLNDYKEIENLFIFDAPVGIAKKIKLRNPKIPVAARTSNIEKENFYSVTKRGFSYIDVIWADESVASPFLTSEIVKGVHDNQKMVYASIINDLQRWYELIEMGIDGICTDYPTELKKVVKKQAV